MQEVNEFDPYALEDPFDEVHAADRTKKKRRGALVSVLVVAVVGIGAWLGFSSGMFSGLAGSEYSTRSIMVTGLGEDFTITAADLAELPTAAETVANYEEQAGGDIYTCGPTLETFLEHYGYSLEDFESVSFVTNTSYSVYMSADTFSKDVVLTIRTPTGALGEKYQPMQVIVPENNNENWAFGVISIDFSTDTPVVIEG